MSIPPRLLVPLEVPYRPHNPWRSMAVLLALALTITTLLSRNDCTNPDRPVAGDVPIGGDPGPGSPRPDPRALSGGRAGAR